MAVLSTIRRLAAACVRKYGPCRLIRDQLETLLAWRRAGRRAPGRTRPRCSRARRAGRRSATTVGQHAARWRGRRRRPGSNRAAAERLQHVESRHVARVADGRHRRDSSPSAASGPCDAEPDASAAAGDERGRLPVRAHDGRPEERDVRLAQSRIRRTSRAASRQVIVAPLARLAARHLRARRHVVPAVRPVIDRMQQQPLVLGGWSERYGCDVSSVSSNVQSRLSVRRAPCSPRLEERDRVESTPAPRSRPRSCRRARASLNGSACTFRPVRHLAQAGRTGVPVRDAVGCGPCSI